MSEALKIFCFIFLAALPGKTTFLLIMLSGSTNTKKILIGAGSAFFIQSFISVAAGQFLEIIPQSYLEIATGLLFVYFAWQFWKESRKSIEVLTVTPRTATSIFVIVFLAEFGDVSQVAIAAASVISSSVVLTFTVSVFALWTITVLALFVGHHLNRFTKPQLLQRIAAFIFMIIGIFITGKGLASLIG